MRTAGCGKCGVWKMQGVENAECGKYVENFPFQFPTSISNAEKQFVNNKKKKKEKEKNAMNHCILRCAGLGG